VEARRTKSSARHRLDEHGIAELMPSIAARDHFNNHAIERGVVAERPQQLIVAGSWLVHP
jgi:hypothetical protein